MKQRKMSIHLCGMKFYAYHGVERQERTVGNTFIVDLELDCDFSQASSADDLSGTVNYASVHQAVKEEMEKPSLLLEHVSARICKRLLDEFPLIDTVRIRLSKTNPPMGADIASCGVGMECSRE